MIFKYKKSYIEYSGCLVSIFGENHYLIAISDINDRKHDQLALSQLNQQLLHAEKMASIGQLAAGIAHELITLLVIYEVISRY
ncbi:MULTISPECIES: hypothetical protein [unclassified Pseudoalteromonas]|uniref:hypothetical protein n=1 Tax=unclassified Pseudoalteromonas TaxID=194690 RepID=UPI0005AA3A46|nr:MULTISPECIES: hypothetical protein [unclassified Pseudoalteromonas]